MQLVHLGKIDPERAAASSPRTIEHAYAEMLDRAAVLFVDEAGTLEESALAASDDAVEQWQGLADQCTADAQMCGDLARMYRARQSTRTGA